MFAWCRRLCKKDAKKKDKKDKKDKDKAGAKEDAKHKHKLKNVYIHSMIGQGKKNTDQDSSLSFEILDEGTLVRFFGIFDGHGDFGREVIEII